MGLVKKTMTKCKPKLVCLEIVTNDFQQVSGKSFNTTSNLVESNIAWDEQQTWRLHSVDLAKRMVLKSDRIYYALGKKSNEEIYKVISQNADSLISIIKLISDECKANDIEFIAFFYPSKYMVTQYQFEQTVDSSLLDFDHKMKTILAQNGHSYFNATIDVSKDYINSQEDHHYRMDGHCTPHGNAVLAEILSKEVQQILAK